MSRPMREVILENFLSKVANLRAEKKQARWDMNRTYCSQPPIITQRELMFYGNACGIPELSSMLSFASTLHDLGSILFYRSNPLLNDYIVLDPSWVISLVAPIFKWPVIISLDLMSNLAERGQWAH